MSNPSRFRIKDRVIVSVDPETTTVGTIIKIMPNPEDDGKIVFLVGYNVPLEDGETSGMHDIDDLRLVPGEADKGMKRKPLEEKVSSHQNLPSYQDYRTKITARLNTMFDALYRKSEVSEEWAAGVTVEGQYRLRKNLSVMSLLDISQTWGELQSTIFSMLISGDPHHLVDAYRALSREVLHSCLVDGTFTNDDGKAIDRFSNAMERQSIKDALGNRKEEVEDDGDAPTV